MSEADIATVTHDVRRWLVPLAIAVLLTMGLVTATSGAATTVNATSYTTSLLMTAPTPSTATLVSRLPQKLDSALDLHAEPYRFDAHRYYVLAKGINLFNFLRTHLPEGYALGTGLSNDTAGMYGTGYELTPACANRHVASCQLGYTVGTFDNGVHELRIDVVVDWVSIHVAELPTTGIVNLTAYDELSLANPPTHLVNVVLSHRQVSQLRIALAALRNEPGDAVCAEGTIVYRLDVVPSSGMRATWSAVDDSCGGTLTVIRQFGSPAFELNGNACSIQHLVMSFLPPGKATASRELLKPCSN